MKTLLIILKVLLIPLITLGQAENVSSVSLKTLENKSVNLSDIIKNGDFTLIYYFDNNSKDLGDHFEYLADLSSIYSKQGTVKIIAIYNSSGSNYNELKPMLDGNSIELETYIDLNGDFQRYFGIPSTSAYLVFDPDQQFAYYYSESVDFNIDILDQQMNSFAYNGAMY